MPEIVKNLPSSDKATPKPVRKKMNYPWEETEVGKSFSVPLEGLNLASLRTMASRWTAKGYPYRVIVHKEAKIVEVAHVTAVEVADKPAE